MAIILVAKPIKDLIFLIALPQNQSSPCLHPNNNVAHRGSEPSHGLGHGYGYGYAKALACNSQLWQAL